jgi:biotin carboxyl carrier protein
MRTYLVDSDGGEVVVDLNYTKVHSSELVEYHFSTSTGGKKENIKTVFVRKLAGQFFSSFDGISWKKVARQNSPRTMLNVNQVYALYRGYKPSGLSGGAEGELLTKMPGKVVKISCETGQKVEKGETLLILEAMKMENEIKSGLTGVVKAIHVKVGDALEEGVLMIEVEGE